jgi:S1-C subfamily serine protease
MKIMLSLVGAVLVSGCASDVSPRRQDNPAIRRLQDEETIRHIRDDRLKSVMTRHIGDRVNLLFTVVVGTPTGSFRGVSRGGRAVALTSDGYFLTAYHVVENRLFQIENIESSERLSGARAENSDINRVNSSTRYSGRIVWYDPYIDLAVLKFPLTNWPHFTNLKVPPTQGDIVITADDEGYGFIPPDEPGQFDLRSTVGDGAFFAAGRVTDNAKYDALSKSFQISTSLIAHDGLSGSPLVTTDYALCGISVKIEGKAPFETPRTVASMIEPRFLFEIIASDRERTSIEE